MDRKVRLRVDRRDGRLLLLYPERGLRLNESGAQVVHLCTGGMTVGAMADLLADRHHVSREIVLGQILDFLDGLKLRGLLAGWPAKRP